jgi:hypothetical protein
MGLLDHKTVIIPPAAGPHRAVYRTQVKTLLKKSTFSNTQVVTDLGLEPLVVGRRLAITYGTCDL